MSSCALLESLIRNNSWKDTNRHDVRRVAIVTGHCSHVRCKVSLQARSVSTCTEADFSYRYHFLAVECHAYLAPLDCHTIYFLKQLINGQRKFLHCDKVQYLSVPQYEGLGVKQFLNEAGKYPQIAAYFPDQDDLRKLPR